MATLTGNTITSTYPLLLKIDSGGVDGTLRKVEDGDATDSSLLISTTAIAIDATDKLYFDAGTHTYIQESASDIMDFYAGGTHMLSLDKTNTEVVINEGSADINFRVEGNGNANLLFCDAGNDRIGIGTASPDNPLEVVGGFKCGSASATSGFNDHAIILCDSGTAYEGGLLITQQDTAAADKSAAKFNVTSSDGSGTADLTIGIVDNEAPNTIIRRWFYCDGATGNVNIGTADTPTSRLVVRNDADFLSATVHVLHVIDNHATADAGDVLARFDYSGDADVHTALAKFISFHDSGGEIGYIATSSDGVISSSILSDVRLKTDIKDTSIDGLNIVNALKVRDFKWGDKANANQIGKQVVGGLVADEVYEVYSKAVHGKPGQMRTEITPATEDVPEKTEEVINPMGVSSSEFISVLIKAVQELSASNDALKTRIEVLEG